MIDWFVGYALRKRLVVAMICVFVSIYGYYSWTQLAVEAAVIGFAISVSCEFLPSLDEGGLFLHGEMVGGISLAKASELRGGWGVQRTNTR
jgi:Cu/Ag efflux pump CusA